MSTREANLAVLADLGFTVASSLPTARSEGPPELRPLEEIVARLCALGALFAWAAESDLGWRSRDIRAFVRNNGLLSWLTPSEQRIFGLPRWFARRRHSQTIGWRLENMWSLAWVLGFAPAPDLVGLIDRDIQGSLLRFLPAPSASLAAYLALRQPRAVHEVDALEDLFYCAHNAVRSAQLGHQTVPPDFHPILHGGAVHERRHALTWSLSPDTDWEDTDLST